jgi:hypothetical protein
VCTTCWLSALVKPAIDRIFSCIETGFPEMVLRKARMGIYDLEF